jgi:hypothetical protein
MLHGRITKVDLEPVPHDDGAAREGEHLQHGFLRNINCADPTAHPAGPGERGGASAPA